MSLLIAVVQMRQSRSRDHGDHCKPHHHEQKEDAGLEPRKEKDGKPSAGWAELSGWGPAAHP